MTAHDLEHVERKLRDSGVFDGMLAASAGEAAAIAKLYAEWAVRLAPYLIADRHLGVAEALRRYRSDRDG
jgi:hypothetical protein